MNQQNSQPEKVDNHRFHLGLLKQGLKCDLDQLEMLKRCSDKKDMTEWNEWRKKNQSEDIFLEGADLTNLYLKDVNLGLGVPKNPRRHVLYGIGSSINVHLRGASFDFSNIKGGSFGLADLRNSYFMDTRLEGACFNNSDLRGAYFLHAIVDSSTLFWECPVTRFNKNDTFTDFTGVSLDSCRIDPKTKLLLEYNIRHQNWEKWYIGDKAKKEFGKIETKKEKFLRIWRIRLRLFATSPVRVFWWISDYGISTKRIIFTFVGLAFVFAIIYLLFALISPPGIVSNLSVIEDTQQTVQDWLLPLRAFYFSVVTMTTLGFGDMYANAQSIWGHIFLTFQVILGYVLLGALVTRFAVLFTAGGPAGKFDDAKER